MQQLAPLPPATPLPSAVSAPAAVEWCYTENGREHNTRWQREHCIRVGVRVSARAGDERHVTGDRHWQSASELERSHFTGYLLVVRLSTASRKQSFAGGIKYLKYCKRWMRWTRTITELLSAHSVCIISTSICAVQNATCSLPLSLLLLSTPIFSFCFCCPRLSPCELFMRCVLFARQTEQLINNAFFCWLATLHNLPVPLASYIYIYIYINIYMFIISLANGLPHTAYTHTHTEYLAMSAGIYYYSFLFKSQLSMILWLSELLSASLPGCLSALLSVYLFVCPSACLSVCLSAWHV